MSASSQSPSISTLTHLLPPTPPQPTHATRLRKPVTNPIPLLPSPLAKNYNRAHTVIVLGLLYAYFPRLVKEPAESMLTLGVIVAALQAVWCAVCLPRSGTWDATTAHGATTATTPSASGGKPKEKVGLVTSAGGSSSSTRRRPPGATSKSSYSSSGSTSSVTEQWSKRLIPTFLTLLLTLSLPPLPLTTLALLMGAPLYPHTSIPATALLATHISLLAFTPLFYAHGISAPAWRDVWAAWLPFDPAGAWGGFVGCFVGGWVGAVPLALDWDREWQVWPVTVLVGCYAGWGVGRVVTGHLGLGWGGRIDLGERDGGLGVESGRRKDE